MTLVQGTTDDGGAGTGADGHRCVVDYSYTQDIANNTSTITYQYGVDYGDPNWWANINERSFTWSATTGTITASTGGGTSESTSSTINTSDPGYGGQTHYFGGNWSGTITVTHDANGEAVARLNAYMEFSSGAYNSDITNHDITLTDIVQDPVAPGTPTATRVNDAQINLSWTNNSSSHHEYASQKVYRSTNGGAYSNIATVSSAATSYSDTTTAIDSKYTYKIQAVNAAGTADSSASSAVYTTPDAPSALTATKLANGNIQLDWTNNVSYGDGSFGIDIYESQDGGAYAYLDSVAGLATYVHVSPSAVVTHRYKVLSTKGALYSGFSNESELIVLTSTASAPTGLSPSGVAVDATEDQTLSWTHNPTDGTPQKRYQLQHDSDGGASYTTVGPTTTATESYTLAASTYANGLTITWRVETAGDEARRRSPEVLSEIPHLGGLTVLGCRVC